MKLRNRAITTEQQSSKQPSTSANADHTEGLPEELLQLLSSFLIQEDVISASMVCKHWAKVLRAGEAGQQGLRQGVQGMMGYSSSNGPAVPLYHHQAVMAVVSTCQCSDRRCCKQRPT